jgi:hypothetical protein
MSADPASTCIPSAIARRAALPAPGRDSSRSAAQTTQGSQLAPARWCHRLTSDTRGPLAVQAAAERKAAAAERPKRRATASMPSPASTKCETANRL